MGLSSAPRDEQVLEEDPPGLPLTLVHLPRPQTALTCPSRFLWAEGVGVADLLSNVSRDVADRALRKVFVSE